MLQHLTELLVKFKFDLSEDVSETGGGVMITHLGISAIYDKIPGGTRNDGKKQLSME